MICVICGYEFFGPNKICPACSDQIANEETERQAVLDKRMAEYFNSKEKP